ncbi:MAG: pyruvate formate lyase family protein [Actinomycetota bacterium]
MHKRGTAPDDALWCPSEGLSPRVARLRREFFSFTQRDYFRNEVAPYTSGTSWDEVFSPVNWGVVPELYPFMPSFRDSLKALARSVPLTAEEWKEPLAVRRARFFHRVVSEQFSVDILDGELIVGGQFNTALSRTHNRVEARAWKKATEAWFKEASALNSLGIGNTGAIPGHLIPNYPKVLRIGLRGIAEEASAAAGDERDPIKRAERQAIAIAATAAKALADRYSGEARRLAGEEPDPERKSELEGIARITARVPWEPARTFWEALQSLWFAHMLVMSAESYPGAGLSPGRIDQYLWPYYRDDLAAGRLDRTFARELLDCYWIKHNYAYDFQGRVGSNQGINSGFGQLITLGGIGPDGEDASNELTWLILEVIEEMNLLEPKPNVRLSEKTPPELLERVAELCARAQGSPFLLNFDETSMKGLAWQGLPAEKLWDYAPVGCLENTLQGNDRSGTVDVNLNLAKAVELVFTRGRNSESGAQIGPRTPAPESFGSFQEFFAAYRAQLSAIMDRLIACACEADRIRSTYEPTPYLSGLVDGCIASGRDITAGGAEHNYITVEGVGLGTAADSLAAVARLVFEDKLVDVTEITKALAANFEGYEKLRQTLARKAPKYGNDDDFADAIAREISQFWTNDVAKRISPATGRRFRGGYLSWNYWIGYAPSTGATPDGRKRGSYLSNGVGPVNGSDRGGPTAVAASVGKLGLETAPNGDSHTLSLSPSLVRDPEHVGKLAGFLRGYGRTGGTALQLNILDADTLRRAQADPEAYSNLLVRVTGYNAYFATLGKELQDEIIARESHEL